MLVYRDIYITYKIDLITIYTHKKLQVHLEKHPVHLRYGKVLMGSIYTGKGVCRVYSYRTDW